MTTNQPVNAQNESTQINSSPVFWYGLVMRPYSLGAQPRNPTPVQYLDSEQAAVKFPQLAKTRSIRHGALAYAQPLSERDVTSFELAADLEQCNNKTFGQPALVAGGRYVESLASVLDAKYASENGDIPASIVESLVYTDEETLYMKLIEIAGDSGQFESDSAIEKVVIIIEELSETPAKIRTLLADLTDSTQ
ncbi:MAG: hypothetical protein HAW67_05265 [Endozoicomonadaceae bacterium]|nr:hypothetical protein [Endozoicomonadaceae bacterium]